MNQQKILQAIEKICNQGCREVNDIIELLENNQQAEQTRHLTTDETTVVLNELKSIMTIYNNKP
jgi:hypothetical protein